MSHTAGHFFIFFTYFPTYIYGEEQHFATLSANTRYHFLMNRKYTKLLLF